MRSFRLLEFFQTERADFQRSLPLKRLVSLDATSHQQQPKRNRGARRALWLLSLHCFKEGKHFRHLMPSARARLAALFRALRHGFVPAGSYTIDGCLCACALGSFSAPARNENRPSQPGTVTVPWETTKCEVCKPYKPPCWGTSSPGPGEARLNATICTYPGSISSHWKRRDKVKRLDNRPELTASVSRLEHFMQRLQTLSRFFIRWGRVESLWAAGTSGVNCCRTQLTSTSHCMGLVS